MTIDFEPADFHIHTVLSPCGAVFGSQAQLATYTRRARELGWRQLCIADHIVEDDTLPWLPKFYHGQNERLLEQTRREAAELANGLDVQIGVEAEMVDVDRFGASAGMARRLDFLIMPSNHFQWDEHVQPPSTDPADVGQHVWAHMRAAAAQPWVDIIAHPFVTFRKDLPPIGQYLPLVREEQWAEIFGLMACHRIALEMSLPHVRGPEYRAAAGPLFRQAVDCGVKLSYGSDSHNVKGLGRFREDVLPFVRSLSLTGGDFATTAMFQAKRR